MVSKSDLCKEFSLKPREYYEVPLFKKQGFSRKQCSKCGKFFWSLGEKRDCGDSTHTEYSFFRKTPLRETYAGFWKKFADFWKKNGHAVIPRYPILSRWREDLPFVIADVVDFQRLENGKIVFEYPENPLVVPQPCLRFVDIANVGVTGRHFSGFMMAGQKSFNHPKERRSYWRDKCMELNYDFLTSVLKVDKQSLSYTEDVWSMPDFSAFGPCVESFSKGSELVNSVFMQYYLEGSKKKELPMKVVDVGWGFERLLWYYNGDATAYDSVFPNVLQRARERTGLAVEKALFEKYARLSSSLDVDTVRNLREEKQKIAALLGISLAEMQKTIAPMQALYAIADHTRTLLWALSDGALPSNTGGGYNLRLLARRCFGFIDEYSLDLDLDELMELHSRDVKELWPEFGENLDDIREIMASERSKYNESLQNASRKVSELLARKEKIDSDKMVLLYESHGITPELVEKTARQKNVDVSVPTDFYKRLAEKHVMEKKEKPKADFEAPPTRLVYYENQDATELQASILAEKGRLVALDKTIFYAEGGGQCADSGTINGIKVVDVQKQGSVVVHHLEKPLPPKTKKVLLKLDAARRSAITKHHSATHVLIQSSRRILGKSVWQAGSRKDEKEAHVDITFFKKLSQAQVDEIERLANEVVRRGLKITAVEMDRGEAERKYGFSLYQGGGAIGKRIRVVEIRGWDVQACGGLHARNTAELGLIKITGVEQVQDGIVRLRYKAGDEAVEFVQEQQRVLRDAAAKISVHAEELPSAVERFFGEWKTRGKELEKAQEGIAEGLAYRLVAQAKEKHEKIVKTQVNFDAKLVEKIALQISREPGFSAIVWNRDGFITVACNPQSGKNAIELLKAENAVGGGSKDFARGKRK